MVVIVNNVTSKNEKGCDEVIVKAAMSGMSKGMLRLPNLYDQ
jgi:hypothetical protein